ncbi:MAG: hypothetical protein ACRC8Y_04995 [Chroococcales cyanobacterium]
MRFPSIPLEQTRPLLFFPELFHLGQVGSSLGAIGCLQGSGLGWYSHLSEFLTTSVVLFPMFVVTTSVVLFPMFVVTTSVVLFVCSNDFSRYLRL